MIFAATTSSHWSSGLIRWGLEEPASHFIVLHNGWVYHATFPEFKRERLQNFLAKSRVIEAILFPHLTEEQEMAIVHNIVKHFHGDRYDFFALAYFTKRAVMKKFCGVDWPERNVWDTDWPICTELAEAIEEIVPSLFKRQATNMSIKSPMWIINSMKDTGRTIPALIG